MHNIFHRVGCRVLQKAFDGLIEKCFSNFDCCIMSTLYTFNKTWHKFQMMGIFWHKVGNLRKVLFG